MKDTKISPTEAWQKNAVQDIRQWRREQIEELTDQQWLMYRMGLENSRRKLQEMNNEFKENKEKLIDAGFRKRLLHHPGPMLNMLPVRPKTQEKLREEARHEVTRQHRFQLMQESKEHRRELDQFLKIAAEQRERKAKMAAVFTDEFNRPKTQNTAQKLHDSNRVTITKGDIVKDLAVSGHLTRMPEYTFSAKVFDVGSQHGIDGGRVSKLEVRKGNDIVLEYSRDWADGGRPEHHTDEQQKVLAEIQAGFPALDRAKNQEVNKTLSQGVSQGVKQETFTDNEKWAMQAFRKSDYFTKEEAVELLGQKVSKRTDYGRDMNPDAPQLQKGAAGEVFRIEHVMEGAYEVSVAWGEKEKQTIIDYDKHLFSDDVELVRNHTIKR